MISKEAIIQIFKKNVYSNTKHNGTISFRYENSYISMLGFILGYKEDNILHSCYLGISLESDVDKYIYFNSIRHSLNEKEYIELFEMCRHALENYDFKLLENVASKTDIDISRRVLTEKRTAKDKFKF